MIFSLLIGNGQSTTGPNSGTGPTNNGGQPGSNPADGTNGQTTTGPNSGGSPGSNGQPGSSGTTLQPDSGLCLRYLAFSQYILANGTNVIESIFNSKNCIGVSNGNNNSSAICCACPATAENADSNDRSKRSGKAQGLRDIRSNDGNQADGSWVDLPGGFKLFVPSFNLF